MHDVMSNNPFLLYFEFYVMPYSAVDFVHQRIFRTIKSDIVYRSDDYSMTCLSFNRVFLPYGIISVFFWPNDIKGLASTCLADTCNQRFLNDCCILSTFFNNCYDVIHDVSYRIRMC